MENTLAIKKYSYICDKGPFLDINEDDIEIDLKNELFIVIDGFGGSNIGSDTSKKIKETITHSYSKITGDPESTMPFFYNSKFLIEGNALVNATLKAQSQIFEDNKKKNLSSRGGASIVAGALAEDIMTFVSVGNCCSLLLRNNSIQFISSPDSYEFVSGNGNQQFFTNFPLNGIGLFETLNFDIKESRIIKGDTIIMLSDGAYNRLNLSELKNIFNSSSLKNKEKIQRSFELVNGRGNQDNQTCLIIEF